METIQEQYAETVKQAQNAMLAGFDTWIQAYEQVFSQLPTAAPTKPEQMIDQVYDFAGKLLDAQRVFAKQLVTSGTAAAETFQNCLAQAAGSASQGTEKAYRGRPYG